MADNATATDQLLAGALGEVERLRAHIREQAIHVRTRIADGVELGATVWRIALEDVARGNEALLSESTIAQAQEPDHAH